MVFHALASEPRRTILGALADGERTVGDLADPFDISLAAISKHLKVLEGAGLVERRTAGRTTMCRLRAEPLAEVRGLGGVLRAVLDDPPRPPAAV